MVSGAEQRMYNINLIMSTIKRAEAKKKLVSFKKLRAELSIRLGLSGRKLREYFCYLSDAGYVEIDGEMFVRSLK